MVVFEIIGVGLAASFGKGEVAEALLSCSDSDSSQKGSPNASCRRSSSTSAGASTNTPIAFASYKTTPVLHQTMPSELTSARNSVELDNSLLKELNEMVKKLMEKCLTQNGERDLETMTEVVKSFDKTTRRWAVVNTALLSFGILPRKSLGCTMGRAAFAAVFDKFKRLKEQRVKDLNKTAGKFSKQVEDLNEQAETLNQQVEDLNQQAETLNQEAETLNNQGKKLKKRDRELHKQRVELIENDKQRVEKLIKKSKERAEELKRAVDTSYQSVQACNTEADELDKQVKILDKQAEKYVLELEKSEGRWADLIEAMMECVKTQLTREELQIHDNLRRLLEVSNPVVLRPGDIPGFHRRLSTLPCFYTRDNTAMSDWWITWVDDVEKCLLEGYTLEEKETWKLSESRDSCVNDLAHRALFYETVLVSLCGISKKYSNVAKAVDKLLTGMWSAPRLATPVTINQWSEQLSRPNTREKSNNCMSGASCSS